MSLASILNDNDDINFPEMIVGNLTADTITARVINGGGGGGGSTASGQSSYLSNTFSSTAPIKMITTDAYSTCIDISFPNPVTHARFSLGGFQFSTNWTFTGTQTPINMNWCLGVIAANTGNGQLVGKSNTLAVTFTPKTGNLVNAYSTTDIELWYIQETPFSEVSLLFQTVNTGGNVAGDGVVSQVGVAGLMRGTVDTSGIEMVAHIN